ncbi:hypothetical protein PF003_g16079 [Phytophthora fragariae]|nr:hypothetical protein PF003_g16079 [Phytophthora fragariae]
MASGAASSSMASWSCIFVNSGLAQPVKEHFMVETAVVEVAVAQTFSGDLELAKQIAK